MNTKMILGFITTLLTAAAFAQTNQTQGVSIAPDETPPSKDAMLDVKSSTKGVLVPRVAYSVLSGTLAPGEIDDLGQDGLLVFVTDLDANYGYWYFDEQEGIWKKLANGSGGDLWEKNSGDNNIYNAYQNDKVGIGTTSPTQRLSVSGGGISVKRNSSSSIEIRITEDNDAYGGHYNEINCHGSSLDLQYLNGQGVRVGSSTVNSWLRVYGTVYHMGLMPFSDSTLKENIVPLRTAFSVGAYNSSTNFLSMIRDVDLYEYNYKADPSNRKQYGVIAQELVTIFPTLVKSDSYSVDKGSGATQVSKMAVDYEGLTMVLLEGVKELLWITEDQRSMIDSLDIRIDSLEAGYQDLLNRVTALENP